MSSYFLLWHETRLISIRRGSIFIFFCFEIWDSAIWPMDIYSRQRKNPSPIDAFTNTSKNVYYELILSILSSAYIECNTHRFFHYYFFFRFAVFYYISTDDFRMQFIDAVEIIYFFHSLHSIKRQTTIHIFRPKYFL